MQTELWLWRGSFIGLDFTKKRQGIRGSGSTSGRKPSLRASRRGEEEGKVRGEADVRGPKVSQREEGKKGGAPAAQLGRGLLGRGEGELGRARP